MASRSAGVDARTEATVPSRSMSRGLSIRSPAGSGGVISRMGRLRVCGRGQRVGHDEIVFGCLTVRTGHGAVRTTRSATLPISRCATAPRPCVPMMIRSMVMSRAYWTTAAAVALNVSTAFLTAIGFGSLSTSSAIELLPRGLFDALLQFRQHGDVRVAAQPHKHIVGHVQDVERGVERAGQFAAIGQGRIGRFAEVSRDEDVLERDHQKPHFFPVRRCGPLGQLRVSNYVLATGAASATANSRSECRSVSTGHGAVRTTFSATLPMRRWASPGRPCVPITMRSMPSDCAYLTISSAGASDLRITGTA